MVTLHNVITANNDKFEYIDGAMQPFANTNAQWKQQLYLGMNSVSNGSG